MQLSLSEVVINRHMSVIRTIIVLRFEMYFTKQMQSEIKHKIQKGNYDLYAIKLKVGVYEDNEEELAQLVDMMFKAWKRMVMYKSRNYLRNYEGIIKRLFFEYSQEKGGYQPFFYLLCIKKKAIYTNDEEYKIRIEKEKLRIQTYIKWFSSWSITLKMCTSVSVGFSLVELENIEKILSEFCTNEKYTLLPLIEETKRELLKKASGDGKHKLVSFHGIFKNRQLSVGR